MAESDAYFLESVAKKDEDARLISYDRASGIAEVETGLSLEGIEFEALEFSNDGGTPLNTSLLRDDANNGLSDVSIRVIFGVFTVAAILNLMTLILGFVPYWLLLFDETKTVATIVFSITITLSCVFLCLMTWQRKTSLGLVFACAWAFTRLFALGSLSALVKNIVPVFMDAIFFGQSVTIVLYTYIRPKYNNTGTYKYIRDLTIAFSVVSFIVWIPGIYIFVEEKAWVYGIISFVVSAAVCVYNWWVVNELLLEGSKYNLSRKDRELASIEYYSRVLILLWNRLFKV